MRPHAPLNTTGYIIAQHNSVRAAARTQGVPGAWQQQGRYASSVDSSGSDWDDDMMWSGDDEDSGAFGFDDDDDDTPSTGVDLLTKLLAGNNGAVLAPAP